MSKTMFGVVMCLLALALIPAANAALVGHWPLDGDVSDATANGNDGTLGGPDPTVTYAEGMIGGAIEFDGQDYASLPVGLTGDTWTLTMWTKVAGTNDGMFVGTGYDYYGDGGRGWESLFIRYYDRVAITGAIDWPAWNAAGQVGLGHMEETIVDFALWNHVAVTYDGDTEDWKYYINGVVADVGNETFPGWFNGQFTIGGVFAANGLQFDYAGLMDDVRLFDHVLSDAEVQGVMQPTLASGPSPANGAILEETSLTLQWNPPLEAADPVAYNVYLGTDPNEASASWYGNTPIAAGTANASVDVIDLELGRQYWRVDVIDPNDGGTPVTIRGLEWSFILAEAEAKGLVGHWKFDGDLSDSAGTVAPTIVGGPVTGTDNGVDGGAVSFGADDVLVFSVEGLGNRVDWTVACWTENVGDNDGMYLCTGNPTGSQQGWESLFMRYYNSAAEAMTGNIDWPEAIGPGGWFAEHSVGWDVWHHTAVTYNGITHDWVYYIDGVVASSGNAEFPGWLNGQFTLGGSYGDGTMRFPYIGDVDDLRLYDLVLTDLEVARLHNPEGAVLPEPTNGATNVAQNADLSWIGAEGAEQHVVYFDPNDVLVAAGDESAKIAEVTEALVEPPQMEWGQTYFWRVDEVLDGGATVVEGQVWSFTVAATLQCDPLPGDLDGDCLVTVNDLAIMAGNWLACSYNNADCP